MRFRAPARAEVPAGCFAHPVFAGYRRHLDLLIGPEWPGLSELNQRIAAADAGIRFIEQDAALLADGQHYELRIARQGLVATRPANWHDLLNALVWIEHAPLKRALNARQVADIVRVGVRSRTRGQCALTHFDEAGVIVVMRDSSVIAAWDRHDWRRLFIDHGDCWRQRIDLVVFGHAVLEHALAPDTALVGKCLVIEAGARSLPDSLAWLAGRIADGSVLADPQELRPLPMLGLPGWHARAGQTDFYCEHPSFQPLRPGRRYPPVLSMSSQEPAL